MEKPINENLDLLIFVKRMELTKKKLTLIFKAIIWFIKQELIQRILIISELRAVSNNRTELDFGLLSKARKYETHLVDMTCENSYFGGQILWRDIFIIKILWQ